MNVAITIYVCESEDNFWKLHLIYHVGTRIKLRFSSLEVRDFVYWAISPDWYLIINGFWDETVGSMHTRAKSTEHVKYPFIIQIALYINPFGIVLYKTLHSSYRINYWSFSLSFYEVTISICSDARKHEEEG